MLEKILSCKASRWLCIARGTKWEEIESWREYLAEILLRIPIICRLFYMLMEKVVRKRELEIAYLRECGFDLIQLDTSPTLEEKDVWLKIFTGKKIKEEEIDYLQSLSEGQKAKLLKALAKANRLE
jgi:hypothetical protein